MCPRSLRNEILLHPLHTVLIALHSFLDCANLKKTPACVLPRMTPMLPYSDPSLDGQPTQWTSYLPTFLANSAIRSQKGIPRETPLSSILLINAIYRVTSRVGEQVSQT